MDCDTIVYALAYKGLFGGNPVTIWNSPVDVVIKMYHYVHFMGVYDETSISLNTKETK